MDKISEIEEKIQALQKMKEALSRFAATCRGEGPILEALQAENMEKI